MLPITGTSLIGAAGQKSMKLKCTIFANLQIKNLIIDQICLLVPKQSKLSILGIDILKDLKEKIDLITLTSKLCKGQNKVKI